MVNFYFLFKIVTLLFRNVEGEQKSESPFGMQDAGCGLVWFSEGGGEELEVGPEVRF